MNKIEFLHETQLKKELKQGQIWVYEDGEPYILSNTSRGYTLISLKDGNWWDDHVEDINNVFSDSRSEFTLYEGILKIDTRD